MSVKVTWRGDELLKQVRDATPDALFDAANRLAKVAAAKAPRSSGALATSGYAATATRSTYQRNKKYRKEIRVKSGEAVAAFSAFYARFVELGTKKMPAKPFLRPAFDELRGQLNKDIVATVGKRLR